MNSIKKEQVVYQGKLTVEQATFSNGQHTFTRERVKREDAVAVLLLNTDTGRLVLTRQFRYPAQTPHHLLEIVAGKIDGNETPEQTAIREVEEEIGYRLPPENLRLLLSCFSSPGYTTERFYVYYATAGTGNRTGAGGGLAGENEHIQVVEMTINEFANLLRTGAIEDAKTWIAGLYLLPEWQHQGLL